MNISGRRLIRLLEREGWTLGRETRHGIFVSRRFPGDRFPRTTVIPNKTTDLGDRTLGAILSVRQTGLGRVGLQNLIDKYR